MYSFKKWFAFDPLKDAVASCSVGASNKERKARAAGILFAGEDLPAGSLLKPFDGQKPETRKLRNSSPPLSVGGWSLGKIQQGEKI